jgi:hypothetical protein
MLEPRIEPRIARHKRTIKIVRSLVLMGGGLLASSSSIIGPSSSRCSDYGIASRRPTMTEKSRIDSLHSAV